MKLSVCWLTVSSLMKLNLFSLTQQGMQLTNSEAKSMIRNHRKRRASLSYCQSFKEFRAQHCYHTDSYSITQTCANVSSLSFQYSVTLQSEEVIAESCRQRASQKPMLVPYSKAHEVCLNLSHTHLLLPIPLHITPTFTTDLGELAVAVVGSQFCVIKNKLFVAYRL